MAETTIYLSIDIFNDIDIMQIRIWVAVLSSLIEELKIEVLTWFFRSVIFVIVLLHIPEE